MKSILKYIIISALITVLFSCQKDPMTEIREGSWNKERNIISIELQNQIGPAAIVRDEFETTITAFVDQNGLDFAAVKVESLVLSYDATADVEIGGILNFDNAEYKSTINVTSKAGETLTWDIILEPYDLFYVGKWAIDKQLIYIDQEWGSKWSEPITQNFANSAFETDNPIDIVYEGYRNGRTYGEIINAAGSDGAYGVFANDGVDITSKLRHLIPEGNAKWEMDLSNNTLYITKNGKTSEAKVSKTDQGMKLVYVLQYKPEEPYWDYGAHDNYLCWSYQFDIELVSQ